jgi:hypothetical protein
MGNIVPVFEKNTTSLIPLLAVTFFFLDLAIFSTRAYVDKYLLTSLALFFLAANFGRRKSPDHGARRKWP